MDILKILAFSLLGAVLSILIKQLKPEFVPFVELSCVIVVFSMIYDGLKQTLTSVFDVVSYTDVVDEEYVSLLLKVLGIAVIGKIGSDVCRDAGNSVLATGVELAGKVVILTLCLPLLMSLLKLTVGIIG